MVICHWKFDVLWNLRLFSEDLYIIMFLSLSCMDDDRNLDPVSLDSEVIILQRIIFRNPKFDKLPIVWCLQWQYWYARLTFGCLKQENSGSISICLSLSWIWCNSYFHEDYITVQRFCDAFWDYPYRASTSHECTTWPREEVKYQSKPFIFRHGV